MNPKISIACHIPQQSTWMQFAEHISTPNPVLILFDEITLFPFVLLEFHIWQQICFITMLSFYQNVYKDTQYAANMIHKRPVIFGHTASGQ